MYRLRQQAPGKPPPGPRVRVAAAQVLLIRAFVVVRGGVLVVLVIVVVVGVVGVVAAVVLILGVVHAEVRGDGGRGGAEEDAGDDADASGGRKLQPLVSLLYYPCNRSNR